MSRPVIHRDPEIHGGVPVFVGTRVPVKNLFDYLRAAWATAGSDRGGDILPFLKGAQYE